MLIEFSLSNSSGVSTLVSHVTSNILPAADVATVAHANHLATFVGEETGGGYLGNTSGDEMQVVLPHSGITVSVPHWCYLTAGVDQKHAGRGVPPDVEVHATIEDVLAGRDVVLEKTLGLIRND